MFSEKMQLRRKFKAEVDIAAVYDALAEEETNPELRRLYHEKSWHEREHAAGIWIRMWSAAITVPTWERSLRSKWLCALARRFRGFEDRIT